MPIGTKEKPGEWPCDVWCSHKGRGLRASIRVVADLVDEIEGDVTNWSWNRAAITVGEQPIHEMEKTVLK